MSPAFRAAVQAVAPHAESCRAKAEGDRDAAAGLLSQRSRHDSALRAALVAIACHVMAAPRPAHEDTAGQP